MRLLPRQRLTRAYYADIETGVASVLKDFLFSPLAGIIYAASPQRKVRVLNTSLDPGALAAAITSGKVQYKAGVFSGEFNAAVTRDLVALGGRFDERERVFRVEEWRVPPYIVSRAAIHSMDAEKTHRALMTQLDTMARIIEDRGIEIFQIGAETMVDKVEAGCKQSAASLKVFPMLTEGTKKALARDYTYNLALEIQGFSSKMVTQLRRDVQQSVQAGYRFDSLIGKFVERYRVSERKAEFLARTETGIFMSEFRKHEMLQVGINDYIWRDSGDGRVRSDHRLLNGKRFSYNNPPVADQATGTRANPGGIWNCRCSDQPIIED